jgi:hypothetical protein
MATAGQWTVSTVLMATRLTWTALVKPASMSASRWTVSTRTRAVTLTVLRKTASTMAALTRTALRTARPRSTRYPVASGLASAGLLNRDWVPLSHRRAGSRRNCPSKALSVVGSSPSHAL